MVHQQQWRNHVRVAHAEGSYRELLLFAPGKVKQKEALYLSLSELERFAWLQEEEMTEKCPVVVKLSSELEKLKSDCFPEVSSVVHRLQYHNDDRVLHGPDLNRLPMHSHFPADLVLQSLSWAS